MSPSAPASQPWTLSDARTSFFAAAVGGGLLTLAWWQASGTGDLDHQATWSGLGVVATVVLVVGGFSWVSSGRRAVRERRRALFDQLLATELPPDTTAELDAASFVAVAGSKRYHRTDCLLVAGKPVRRLTAARHGSRRPCEMCQPSRVHP
jgi:hypothetical protein